MVPAEKPQPQVRNEVETKRIPLQFVSYGKIVQQMLRKKAKQNLGVCVSAAGEKVVELNTKSTVCQDCLCVSTSCLDILTFGQ